MGLMCRGTSMEILAHLPLMYTRDTLRASPISWTVLTLPIHMNMNVASPHLRLGETVLFHDIDLIGWMDGWMDGHWLYTNYTSTRLLQGNQGTWYRWTVQLVSQAVTPATLAQWPLSAIEASSGDTSNNYVHCLGLAATPDLVGRGFTLLLILKRAYWSDSEGTFQMF